MTDQSAGGGQPQGKPANTTVELWRRHFLPGDSGHESASAGAALEGAAGGSSQTEDPVERIKSAKEAMIRLIKDQFGGDRALVDQVEKIAVTGAEAVAILKEPIAQLNAEHLSAFETIVAFDGTRPSFLLKEDAIDFGSSFNTANWKQDLTAHVTMLATLSACVGRVELNEEHMGTAFLVTPELAITNRHVAQLIARFEGDRVRLAPGVTVDFGREQWNGCKPRDTRAVKEIAFVGKDPIVRPIVHDKLDLAVLRVAPSTLEGEAAKRHLPIAPLSAEDFDFARHAVAIGYPAKPDGYVPQALQNQFADVLRRLLEGDGGVKRLAPGAPGGVLGGSPGWTAMHDATTISGNSGSPLVVIKYGPKAVAEVAGLHYGGAWGGNRINFAHLLALVGNEVGFGGKSTFAEFCKAEGIGA